MAAQIASFVQNADSDAERSTTIHATSTTKPSQPVPTSTIISSSVEPPVSSSSVTRETVHAQVHTAVQRESTPERFEAPLHISSSRSSSSNSRVSPENNEAYPIRTSRTPDRAHSSSPVSLSSTTNHQVEKQINTLERNPLPKIVIREATLEKEPSQSSSVVFTITETKKTDESKKVIEHHQVNTVPTVEIVRTISGPEVLQVESLNISESLEDLPTKFDPLATSSANDRNRYKIRFVALKPAASEYSSELTSIKPNSSWLHSTKSASNADDVPVENHDYDNVVVRSNGHQESAPPKRRRSVRDIIASINKSQSLLRINQDPNAASLAMDKRLTSIDQFEPPSSQQPINSESNESIVRNLTELQASEQQIRQTISEMERNRHDANNNNDYNLNHLEDDSLVHIPVMAERFSEFSEEFKKCNVNGMGNTSSPLQVQFRDKSERTDWNPLPKPRRSRNLTHEVEAAAAKSERR